MAKKWALLIVAVLGGYGKLRFKDLMEKLRGVSPKTLSDTLKLLEREGIVERKAYNEIPPRVDYSLTEDGVVLRRSVIPLLRWAVQRSSDKDCIILGEATRHSTKSPQPP